MIHHLQIAHRPRGTGSDIHRIADHHMGGGHRLLPAYRIGAGKGDGIGAHKSLGRCIAIGAIGSHADRSMARRCTGAGGKADGIRGHKRTRKSCFQRTRSILRTNRNNIGLQGDRIAVHQNLHTLGIGNLQAAQRREGKGLARIGRIGGKRLELSQFLLHCRGKLGAGQFHLQGIAAAAAIECIGSGPPSGINQLIHTVGTHNGFIARAIIERVVTRPAPHVIITRAAHDHVVAAAAHQHIVTSAAHNGHIAQAIAGAGQIDDLIAGPGVDFLNVGHPSTRHQRRAVLIIQEQRLVAVAHLNGVVGAGPLEHILAFAITRQTEQSVGSGMARITHIL